MGKTIDIKFKDKNGKTKEEKGSGGSAASILKSLIITAVFA